MVRFSSAASGVGVSLASELEMITVPLQDGCED